MTPLTKTFYLFVIDIHDILSVMSVICFLGPSNASFFSRRRVKQNSHNFVSFGGHQNNFFCVLFACEYEYFGEFLKKYRNTKNFHNLLRLESCCWNNNFP